MAYTIDDSGELFPPISPMPGRFAFAKEAVYPNYLNPPYINLCPSAPEWKRLVHDKHRDRDEWTPEEVDSLLDDVSYFYLSYAVENDDDVLAFAQEYHDAMEANVTLDSLITEDGYITAKDGRRLYRLRYDIQQFLRYQRNRDQPYEGDEREEPSKVPVLIERLGNHKPNQAHVLFTDGHVELLTYPVDWPLTETTMRVLNELDRMHS